MNRTIPWAVGIFVVLSVIGLLAGLIPTRPTIEDLQNQAKRANEQNQQIDAEEVRKGEEKEQATLVSATGNEIRLLAHVIHGEARAEPYVGQVAVAAVVLNRVDSPLFPDSIAGVIYEPGAFTAVSDGQINLQPNQTSFRAARDALNGWDPTNGAIYYYNPARTTNRWIWSRPRIGRIGRHIFAR